MEAAPHTKSCCRLRGDGHEVSSARKRLTRGLGERPRRRAGISIVAVAVVRLCLRVDRRTRSRATRTAAGTAARGAARTTTRRAAGSSSAGTDAASTSGATGVRHTSAARARTRAPTRAHPCYSGGSRGDGRPRAPRPSHRFPPVAPPVPPVAPPVPPVVGVVPPVPAAGFSSGSSSVKKLHPASIRATGRSELERKKRIPPSVALLAAAAPVGRRPKGGRERRATSLRFSLVSVVSSLASDHARRGNFSLDVEFRAVRERHGSASR
jgi:hypothetical protein